MITELDANTINCYDMKQAIAQAHGILQASTTTDLQNGHPIVGDIQDSPLNGRGHTTPERLPVSYSNTLILLLKILLIVNYR